MREVVKKTRGQGKPEFLPAETGRALSELSDDAVRRRYISKSVSQVEKAGRVHILVVAPRAVSQEKDTIIPIVGVTGGGFTAHVGHDS